MMNKIQFWNGNKSLIRQQYELAILNAVLDVTQSTTNLKPEVIVDYTDYPSAEDEGNVFSKGSDLLVTVAGNLKFSDKTYIPVHKPIAKGLLGYRILITRQDFKSLLEPKYNETKRVVLELKAGIPKTWADAELFRENGYKVFEKGSFDEIFQHLSEGECDYVSLGANEVQSVYQRIANTYPNLIIEPDLVLYYPFPLVFYVHPEKLNLAKRIEYGLALLTDNGQLDALFEHYFSETLRELDLGNRNVISLRNPILPEELTGTSTPSLLNVY
ncbi:ABC transporter substrate-binding protein [Vibrio sp. F74]|uniref:ABC transporter substrate-binding protein n=1 Tax=Vibrio sp. F74 TaxID=700020 RepID=UPI0035F5EA2D